EVADLDLDAELSFGSAKTQAPVRAAKPASRSAAAAAPERSAPSGVWELEDAPGASMPAAGPVAVTLEIDGLSGELRRAIEALVGKTIELPRLRVKTKGRGVG